jgi:hypothetical protein
MHQSLRKLIGTFRQTSTAPAFRRGRRRLLREIAAFLAVSALVLQPVQSASAQVEDGATMTVLRGQVAVVRPDGTARQPAPSGILVYAGDEIRTLSAAGALITFFVGTELELGDDTVIRVEAASRDGERIEVSLTQVLGQTVSRVETFAHPGSSYRVEAGGAVALVRG